MSHDATQEGGLHLDCSINPPELGWEGPTIEDEVHRLILLFGADAVKVTIKQLSKSRRGPKEKPDWPALLPEIVREADEWLAGTSPSKPRSRNAIARSLSGSLSGNSQSSTQTRLRRKVKDRDWWVCIIVIQKGREGYPHVRYIAALKKLVAISAEAQNRPSAGKTRDFRISLYWGQELHRVGTLIDKYTRNLGGPPHEMLSIKDIEDAVQTSMTGAPAGPIGALSLLTDYVPEVAPEAPTAHNSR